MHTTQGENSDTPTSAKSSGDTLLEVQFASNLGTGQTVPLVEIPFRFL
jgi:hypothetical protein